MGQDLVCLVSFLFDYYLIVEFAALHSVDCLLLSNISYFFFGSKSRD